MRLIQLQELLKRNFVNFFLALDVVLYGTHFYGMKLAGIILISIGFFLVMFPDDWPDYITRLLRLVIMCNIELKFIEYHKIS